MINSKQEMQNYIREDKKRNLGAEKINLFVYWAKRIYGTDDIKAFLYLQSLRKCEYARNCLKNKSFIGKIIYLYRKLCLHRLSEKYNIVIGENMVGYGFRIPHIVGGGIIINANSIGNYCSVNVGVIVGNNHKWNDRPSIGDNVKLTMGAKVYGGVTIGNNVIVAPNSVVVKDVPDNCVVSGVPAKIITKDGKRVDSKK